MKAKSITTPAAAAKPLRYFRISYAWDCARFRTITAATTAAQARKLFRQDNPGVVITGIESEN